MTPQHTKRLILAATLVAEMGFGSLAVWRGMRATDERAPQLATAALPLPTVPATPAISPPSFDVVRVDSKGSTVIAGRAEPGAVVVIVDGDKEIGRVSADERGEWVFVPTIKLTPGAHEVRLRATIPGSNTMETQEPVILVVPDHPDGTALAIRERDGGDTVVLQGPQALPGAGPVSIDTVHYGNGRLAASGKADKQATLQLYLDEHVLGRIVAAKDGRWHLPPGAQPLAAGDHTLRADQITGDGTVTARAEVSFDSGHGHDTTAVTVQPGNSLWRIAHRRYGQGSAYTVIYQANKAQIRNPDLIYPGQVFSLPR